MDDAKNIFLRHITGLLDKLEQELEETVDQPLSDELRARTLALLSISLQSEAPSEWEATCNLILQFAPKIEQAGYRNDWFPYLQRAIALSRQIGDLEGEASLGLQLGILYQLDSQWDLAKENLHASAEQHLASGKLKSYANILNRLGYIARSQGQLAQAEQLANQALNHLQENDPERHFSLFVLGVVASDRLDWQGAENYYRQSLEICERHHDIRNTARRHRDIGVALNGQDKLRTARTCYEQAICLFEQLGDRFEAAVTKMNLGVVYSKLGNSYKALDYYAEAEKVFRQIRDELQLGYVLFNQGVDYQELERFSEAENKFKAAIAIRQRVSNPASVIYAQTVLGELYLQIGNRNDAFSMFDEGLRNLDQIDEVSITEQYRNRIEANLAQRGERQ